MPLRWGRSHDHDRAIGSSGGGGSGGGDSTNLLPFGLDFLMSMRLDHRRQGFEAQAQLPASLLVGLVADCRCSASAVRRVQ